MCNYKVGCYVQLEQLVNMLWEAREHAVTKLLNMLWSSSWTCRVEAREQAVEKLVNMRWKWYVVSKLWRRSWTTCCKRSSWTYCWEARERHVTWFYDVVSLISLRCFIDFMILFCSIAKSINVHVLLYNRYYMYASLRVRYNAAYRTQRLSLACWNTTTDRCQRGKSDRVSVKS